MAKKAVVTGAAGFIGSHLCDRLLQDGFEVTGIDSLTDYYDVRIKRENLKNKIGNSNFYFLEQSINDLDLVETLSGTEFVFHQAAQAGVRASWGSRFEEYIDCNIRATQRLLEALKSLPVKRIIVASSSSVYGDTTVLPMEEEHRTCPVSPYGATKLATEHLCDLYRINFTLPVVSLRYFTVYGPRQRPDMAFHKFIRWATEGKPLEIFGNGTQTRDFTYIDDIIEANVSCMEYDGPETVFNIGGGSRVTLNVVLDILGEHFGGSLDIRYSDVFKGDVKHTYAGIARAERELGYRPRTGLEEGIAREVEWVRSIHKKLGDM